MLRDLRSRHEDHAVRARARKRLSPFNDGHSTPYPVVVALHASFIALYVCTWYSVGIGREHRGGGNVSLR